MPLLTSYPTLGFEVIEDNASLATDCEQKISHFYLPSTPSSPAIGGVRNGLQRWKAVRTHFPQAKSL